MSAGLQLLNGKDEDQDIDSREVDIIAIHGLFEDSTTAWTHPDTGFNWLREALPRHVSANVYTYGYDASLETFFGSNAEAQVDGLAISLIQDLTSERRFPRPQRQHPNGDVHSEKHRQRPIIFLCHGLGGIIVKRALVYSSTRTGPHVKHLLEPYFCTFAIVFFGTPHSYTSVSRWRDLANMAYGSRVPFEESVLLLNDRHSVTPLNGNFGSLLKHYRFFSFWEGKDTLIDGQLMRIVDSTTAVLDLDDTEKGQMYQNHMGMCQLSSFNDPNYRTILDAIIRYSTEAPDLIRFRWQQHERRLEQLRHTEITELSGMYLEVPAPDIRSRSSSLSRSRSPSITPSTTIRHFRPPQVITSDYFGREQELDHVHHRFFTAEANVGMITEKSFVIYGMAGSGKTSFSTKYAYVNRDEYLSVITIFAVSKETIVQSLSEVAKLGGFEPTESSGRHYLSELPGPWLLVIDNADDPELDLRSLFPIGGSAHVLITTRNPGFQQEGSLGHLRFEGLSPRDSRQLLLLNAGVKQPWRARIVDAANAIAKALGYLALALIHAGKAIHMKICKIENLVQMLSTPGYEDNKITSNLYALLNAASKSMSEHKGSQSSQDALELLNILGFYHFQYIPISMFERAVVNRGPSKQTDPGLVSRLTNGLWSRLEPPVALPHFIAGLARDDQQFHVRIRTALNELQQHSLIRYDDSSGKTFSIHPLVHSWMRDRCAVEEKQYRGESQALWSQKVWSTIALNTMLEAIMLPPHSNSKSDGAFHALALPHLTVCLRYGEPLTDWYISLGWLEMFLTKIVPTPRITMSHSIQRSAKCGYVFLERGQFQLATKHLKLVKDTLLKVAGIEDEKTQAAMLALAKLYWGLGDLEEALTLQYKVLSSRQRSFGPYDARTLEIMNEVGSSHWLHGNYELAVRLHSRAAEKMQLILPEDDDRLLNTLDNYGVTLSAWYRYDESREIHLKVLQIRRRKLGETHLDTLMAQCNLAMALLGLGTSESLTEAQTLMHQVHQERHTQMGREHPWTLWALCWLSKINTELGNLEAAESALIWGIEAGKRTLSDDHLGVLMGRGELARIWSRSGRQDEAEILLKDVIRGLEASRGIEHPDCVYALSRLGLIYHLRGKYSEAMESYELSLDRADMRLSMLHPLAIETKRRLEEARENLLPRGKI